MSKGSTTEESVKIQRVRVLSWRHRIAPFLTPWFIWLGVYVTSMITDLVFNTPVKLIILTLMAPALALVTWITWDRRHEHARNAATAFVLFMGLWLALATAVSPYNSIILFMWLAQGAFLCLVWNIRYAGITPTNKHDAVSGQHVDALSAIKRLKGVVTKKVKEVEDGAGQRVEIILQHPGGKSTTKDVQTHKDNVAGAYSVDPTAVQVAGVRGRGDQTRVTVRTSDPTSSVVLWPGVSMPGQSITAGPLRTGVYEDSQPFGHWITGSDEESRAASATMYTGMTGAGKTRSYILSMLEMTSRTDCAVPAIADPEKFLLSFGMIMDYVPIAADGPAQTDQLVSNVITALRYRARLLGSLGFEQWTPECWTDYGIPVQPVHIEEAGGYLANNPEFTRALMICRSMGMPISISLQVAVYRQLQREARSQFGNSLAFGVKELRDAAFALTDGTIAAGARPDAWANNEPGRFYGEVSGVPAERWPLKARAYKIGREKIIADFEANRDAGIAQCDPGTFELLSRGIERPKRMIITPDWLGATGSAEPVPAQETITIHKPALQVLPGDGQPVEDAAPTVDLSRELINGRVDELETSGITEATAADFEDLVQALGRDRTWIYLQFRRLVAEDRLARIGGKGARYRIVPRDHRKEV